MALSGQDIITRAREGTLSLAEIRAEFETTASASAVSVQDWGVCYSSTTGQLSEYCTVMASNPANPITGVGMLAYSADGTSLYALQYTNGLSSPEIATSIGTTLFQPGSSPAVLCIVYGWTVNASYYQAQTIPVGQC